MATRSKPWRRVAARGGLAVLLIRHARTRYNAERRFCGGRSDPPLDERGQAELAPLRERFASEVEAVFCSPQLRARQTAAALGHAQVIEELRELDQGELEGRELRPALAEHAEFFARWTRDPTHERVPGGGESMGQLAARTHAALTGLARAQLGDRPSPQRSPQHGPEAPGRVIAVVGHQMAQAAFLCAALGAPLRRWPDYELRNASANLAVWDGRAWSLLARNL